MKKITLVIGLLCLQYASIAQQAAILKSYAYAQEFMPGVQRQDEEVKAMNTYFIYLEILKRTDIDVKYIWIDKQCSVPTTVPVTKLPVIIANSEGMGGKNDSEQLVPKTNNTVLQLMQTDAISDRKLTTGRRLAAKNAFVIAYIYKGKWYYYTGQKITALRKQFGM